MADYGRLIRRGRTTRLEPQHCNFGRNADRREGRYKCQVINTSILVEMKYEVLFNTDINGCDSTMLVQKKADMCQTCPEVVVGQESEM